MKIKKPAIQRANHNNIKASSFGNQEISVLTTYACVIFKKTNENSSPILIFFPIPKN